MAVLSTLVNSPRPVTKTPHRLSGVGANTAGPLLPSGPLTPAKPVPPLSEKPLELKPVLPAWTLARRCPILDTWTLPTETAVALIELIWVGAINERSWGRSAKGWLLRKANKAASRGSPLALSSAFATARSFGVTATPGVFAKDP